MLLFIDMAGIIWSSNFYQVELLQLWQHRQQFGLLC